MLFLLLPSIKNIIIVKLTNICKIFRSDENVKWDNKAFYSEIVKTKINNLDSSGYSLRDECKEIRNITLKIDSVFLSF